MIAQRLGQRDLMFTRDFDANGRHQDALNVVRPTL
jgi:hypothetical protein